MNLDALRELKKSLWAAAIMFSWSHTASFRWNFPVSELQSSRKSPIVDVWLSSEHVSELQYVVCISNLNTKLVSFDFSSAVISTFTCLRLSFFQSFRSMLYPECISGRKIGQHDFNFLFDISLSTSLAGLSFDYIFQTLTLIFASNSGNGIESADCNWDNSCLSFRWFQISSMPEWWFGRFYIWQILI